MSTEHAQSEQTFTKKQGFTNNYNTNYLTQTISGINGMSPPPQDYSYDPPATTSASQGRITNGSNVTMPSFTPPWNGQGQINGATSASGSAAYNSTYEPPSTNHVNALRQPINGITINTSNLPATNSTIIPIESGKILCVADVRGNISLLNQLARETGAMAVIHSGDFGFYENSSLERISDRALRHLVQYSSLISPELRKRLLESTTAVTELRKTILESSHPLLSEFPLFLEGKMKLNVPVYTIWGACEDVSVLEKFRSEDYKVHNLNILDESSTYLIDIGNVNLRLFGLGGAVVQHKLFDIGDGTGTIAGGHGTMWTTTLQIGELVDTASKVYHPTETRVLVTHGSPGREGLLAQLSLVLRADFTISSGLHFRYGISYNEFSVQSDQESFRNKLENSRKSFYDMWDSVKSQVEASIDAPQRALLKNALTVIDRMPPQEKEDPAFKNMWNFNLPDAAYGHLILNVNNGRVSTEAKAQGFNFAYRRDNAQSDGSAVAGASIQALNSPSPVSRRQLSQWQPPASQNLRSVSPMLNHRSSSPLAFPSSDQNSTNLDPRSWSDETPVSNDRRTTPMHHDQTELLQINSTTSNISSINNNISTTIPTVTNNIINGNESNDSNSENIATTQDNSSSRWADDATWNNKPESNMYSNDVGERPESPQINQNGDDTSSTGLNQNYNQNQNRRDTQLFMGHLNSLPNEEEIRNFFGDNSGIESVRLIYDRGTGIQRNHAYVDFVDEESFQRALQLNGQNLGEDTPVLKKAELYHERNRGNRGGRRGRGNYGRHRGGSNHQRHNPHRGGV